MSHPRYAISGVVLESAVAFPELTPATARADWTFALSEPRPATAAPAWFHTWRLPGGPRTASFGRRAGGYLLRFHGQGDFAIDVRRRSIHCHKRRGADMATIRHLLLDQVIPLLLSREVRMETRQLGTGSQIPF